MITRAQAEALLTLAESLEACERLGVVASLNVPSEQFGVSGMNYVTAMGLRFAISENTALKAFRYGLKSEA